MLSTLSESVRSFWQLDNKIIVPAAQAKSTEVAICMGLVLGSPYNLRRIRELYRAMLKLLDVVLSAAHLALVFFNLFGWIPSQTRKAHLISVGLTAASWFVLGIWFGTGYCPLTDWQWNVKAKLGERDLPPNFIEYFLEKIFVQDVSSAFVNTLIAVLFAAAAILSVSVNFIMPALVRRRSRT